MANEAEHPTTFVTNEVDKIIGEWKLEYEGVQDKDSAAKRSLRPRIPVYLRKVKSSLVEGKKLNHSEETALKMIQFADRIIEQYFETARDANNHFLYAFYDFLENVRLALHGAWVEPVLCIDELDLPYRLIDQLFFHNGICTIGQLNYHLQARTRFVMLRASDERMLESLLEERGYRRDWVHYQNLTDRLWAFRPDPFERPEKSYILLVVNGAEEDPVLGMLDQAGYLFDLPDGQKAVALLRKSA